jgi:hypothetical protein
MDEINNIVKQIKKNKSQNVIYNHIINDLWNNSINMYSLIFLDLDFILSIPVALIDIDVSVLFRYFIYFQHSKDKYYNIFSKTFHKFEKIKYMIYYKNNRCVMCYCNYHDKLNKYFYRGIENDIAIDILKTQNIYNSKVISIYLESFLEHTELFINLDSICTCIKDTFQIKN